MCTKHYLVRWDNSLLPQPTAEELEATVRQGVPTCCPPLVVEDLSLLMGEPALAVAITASDEERLQALGEWTQRRLVIEDLDREVRAQPDSEGK